MFFTKNGYERHLMRNHKIWNVGQYQPEIIEETIWIFGQDGYETTYQKVDTIEESKKVKLVEYSCDKDNNMSGMQNEQAEDGKMAEKDDANENSNAEGGGKDITAGPWTFTPLHQLGKRKRKKRKLIHCQLCSESFFYNSGLRTHMEHAASKTQGK